MANSVRNPSARRLAALAAIVLGLITSIPGRAEAQQQQPLTINVIMNETGSNAFAGQDYVETIKVFEDYINKRGGVRGRPVHFSLADDGSNPQTAVQLATTILTQKPNLIYGPAQTATCLAVAPLMVNGPVTFCLTPGPSPASGGYVFAASVALAQIEPAMVRFLRLKGARKIAMISTTDASGQATEKFTNDAVAMKENAGVQIVAAEHFNVTDTSVTAQISRIKAAQPDALIIWAAGGAFGTAVRALSDAGLDIPTMTTAANLNPNLMKQFAHSLPTNLYFNGLAYFARDQLPAGQQRDRVTEFFAAFRGAHTEPTPESGFAWDPLLIGIDALNKLGPNVQAGALRDYLLNLHGFAGISGVYDFRRGDQHGLTDQAVTIVRWDDAKQQFVVMSKLGGAPL